MDYLKLTHDKLSVEDISDLVNAESCGAISIFIGTTRDNFEGKTVTQLEYEAYEGMAINSLQKICNEMREQWPNIVNVAIYHRLGVVSTKEASIVIAISSPHRADALNATQWCINIVKEKVPIWKKEIYEDNPPEWKENKEYESFPKTPHSILSETQAVEMPYTSPHLIQIKASNKEIEERIERFMKRKRDEINRCNIRDFCTRDPDVENEVSCARIDSILIKRKDSKGHLQVNRVYNSYCYRDQNDMGYLEKYMPPNGIEERVRNLESQLSLNTPVPRSMYGRLKEIEDRLIYLESVSPEYIQFWEKSSNGSRASKKKRKYNIQEIDRLILDLENKRTKICN